jgi:hypothetical protein
MILTYLRAQTDFHSLGNYLDFQASGFVLGIMDSKSYIPKIVL